MVTSKELIKKRFSERAPHWAALYADPESRTSGLSNLMTRQRFVLQMVEAHLPRGSKILDVGCGPGEMALKLVRRGYDVWGVDIAEPMIRYAQERCGAAHFRVGDLERIPFPDDAFDGVVCLGVIEYLDVDDAALSEIRRVLRPGGTAVITTPSATCPLYHIDRVALVLETLFARVRHTVRRKPVPNRPAERPSRKYLRRRWFERLRASGLEPEEWVCYGWGWHVSTLLTGLIERLARIAERFRGVLRRLLGPSLLERAGDGLARNRMLNWVGYEQVVGVRAAK